MFNAIFGPGSAGAIFGDPEKEPAPPIHDPNEDIGNRPQDDPPVEDDGEDEEDEEE